MANRHPDLVGMSKMAQKSALTSSRLTSDTLATTLRTRWALCRRRHKAYLRNVSGEHPNFSEIDTIADYWLS